MIRTVLSSLLLLSPGFAQEMDPELGARLRAISSSDSAERQAAEGWLGVHLRPEHREPVAQAARAGDLEVQRRLARAISEADRDLRLASGFLVAEEPTLRELGQRALASSIVQWNAEAWREGIHGQALALHLRRLSTDSWPQVVRVPILPSLGETCALLEQRAGLPLGLAVAPSVAARRPLAGIEQVTGTWDELVVRLAEVYRVAFDGHGFAPDPSQANGRVFLRFCPPTRLGEPSNQVLVDWCAEVAGAAKTSLRVAAARALASSGWDAALEWLSIRVELERDPAALEGVLAAAAGGRLARILGQPELLTSMVSTAQADLQRGDPEGRARRILAAFQHMRAMGPGGERRLDSILSGWEQADLSGRWLRLAILTELRSPGARSLAAGLLAQPSLEPLLYRQAFLLWSAGSAGFLQPGSLELAAPELLFGAHRDLRSAIALAQGLQLAGLEPPSGWTQPAGLPASFDALDRACVLAWFVLRKQPEPSAAHWAAQLSGSAQGWRAESLAMAQVLEAIGLAHVGTLRKAWSLARAGRGASLVRLGVDRSAFLAGILDPEQAAQVWAQLEASSVKYGLDLMGLAVSAGGGWNETAAQEARTQLLAQLSLALREERSVEQSAALLAALERSVEVMQRRGWELSQVGMDRGRRSLSEQWSEQIGRQARRWKRSELGTYFTLQWPPAAEAGIRDLEAEARLPLQDLELEQDSATE